MMYDCCGLGFSTWDETLLVENYPELNEKTDILENVECPGGPVLNALRFLTVMGKSVYFAGHAGNDFRGEQLKQALEMEGIYLPEDFCQQNAFTSFAHIWVDKKNAKRTVCSVDTSQFMLTESIKSSIRSSATILTDNRFALQKTSVLKEAKENGAQIFCDFGSPRPHSMDLLSLVDEAIVSERFVTTMFKGLDFKDAMAEIRKIGPEVVIVTLGERGCFFLDNEKFLEKKAFHMENIRDTNGAGDIFHGAWIYGRRSGWGIEKILKFSTAAAALQCTVLGTDMHVFSNGMMNQYLKSD